MNLKRLSLVTALALAVVAYAAVPAGRRGVHRQ